MIRKATPSDIKSIEKLAILALEQDKTDDLIISPKKVRELIKFCVSSARNFVWVSENDGEVVGVLGAIVSEMEFYERDSAAVMIFYCPGGEGMRLMAKFLSWVKGRPMIKQVQFTWERNGDPRLLRVLEERYGFNSDVPFLYWNRVRQ